VNTEKKDRIEELTKQITENNKKEEAQRKAKENITRDLAQAVPELEGIKPKIQKLREARQRLLAQGKPAEKENAEIKRLQEAAEILEDKTIGLSNLLDEISEDLTRLPLERRALEEAIIREKRKPVLKRCNELGKAYAESLTELEALNFQLGESAFLHVPRNTMLSSDYEGVQVIPQFYEKADLEPGSDIRGTDYFSVYRVRQNLMKARETEDKQKQELLVGA